MNHRQRNDKQLARKKSLAKAIAKHMQGKEVICLRQPEELCKALRAIAQRKKVSVNKFCGAVLRAAVEHLNERDRQ